MNYTTILHASQSLMVCLLQWLKARAGQELMGSGALSEQAP